MPAAQPAYGPYGSATAGQAYNPYTGTAARGASVSPPMVRPRQARPTTLTPEHQQHHQTSNAYGMPGSSTYNNGHGTTTQTTHSTNNYGQTTATAENSNGAKAAGVSGANGSATVAKGANGDMYASKDGNVYSNSGGSWSQASNTKPHSVIAIFFHPKLRQQSPSSILPDSYAIKVRPADPITSPADRPLPAKCPVPRRIVPAVKPAQADGVADGGGHSGVMGWRWWIRWGRRRRWLGRRWRKEIDYSVFD